MLTLSVSKRLLAEGLYKFCVFVCMPLCVCMCCNAHLMRQGPGRGEKKPEGRQLRSHWRKLKFSLWSASLSHCFLSFCPYFFSLSSLFLFLFISSPCFSFFQLFTCYSSSVFPSLCPPASYSTAYKLSSLCSFLFFSYFLSSFFLYPWSPPSLSPFSLLTHSWDCHSVYLSQTLFQLHSVLGTGTWALLFFIPAF